MCMIVDKSGETERETDRERGIKWRGDTIRWREERWRAIGAEGGAQIRPVFVFVAFLFFSFSLFVMCVCVCVCVCV